MDIGVAGRIGRIAVRHVMMASEQDSGNATIHRPLMTENFVKAMEMIGAPVF